jgi:hypothetical protein
LFARKERVETATAQQGRGPGRDTDRQDSPRELSSRRRSAPFRARAKPVLNMMLAASAGAILSLIFYELDAKTSPISNHPPIMSGR